MKYAIIILTIALASGGVGYWFYWTNIRPANIREECQQIVKEGSQDGLDIDLINEYGSSAGEGAQGEAYGFTQACLAQHGL